ncbi:MULTISPECIES: hypothetical protein [Pseudomonas]|nr:MULTISPECIES: hypothetical protein [Pseudomonas]NSX06974.1 hypothetical protein [Pseudomonas lini]
MIVFTENANADPVRRFFMPKKMDLFSEVHFFSGSVWVALELLASAQLIP